MQLSILDFRIRRLIQHLLNEGGIPSLQLSPRQFDAKNDINVARFGNFPTQLTPSD